MSPASDAPLVPGPADDSSTSGLDRFWDEQVRWWHLIFAVLWAVTVGIAVVEPPGEGGRAVELALLTVVGIAYAVWGRPALVTSSWRGWAYVVTAWSALVAIHALNAGAESWLLFFILFPHLWAILSQRAAAAMSVVVVVGVGLARWVSSERPSADTTSIVVSSAISIALSLLLGLFISRMVEQATERARTIDELRATQDQLAALERDRGIGKERERLSREIHDTLAQGFTSALALTRAADAALARGDIATARQRLALVEETAADNLREARLIVAELTPGHLQSRTLVEALTRLVGTIRESAGVDARLVVDGEPVALGGAKEVVLLRAAQEALSNVRRHAAARSAVVGLDYGPGAVTLAVRDDGIGFDSSGPSAGFGLDGLRARAAEVGGRLTLTSAPGRGTTLLVEVPT